MNFLVVFIVAAVQLGFECRRLHSMPLIPDDLAVDNDYLSNDILPRSGIIKGGQFKKFIQVGFPDEMEKSEEIYNKPFEWPRSTFENTNETDKHKKEMKSINKTTIEKIEKKSKVRSAKILKIDKSKNSKRKSIKKRKANVQLKDKKDSTKKIQNLPTIMIPKTIANEEAKIVKFIMEQTRLLDDSRKKVESSNHTAELNITLPNIDYEAMVKYGFNSIVNTTMDVFHRIASIDEDDIESAYVKAKRTMKNIVKKLNIVEDIEEGTEYIESNLILNDPIKLERKFSNKTANETEKEEVQHPIIIKAIEKSFSKALRFVYNFGGYVMNKISEWTFNY